MANEKNFKYHYEYPHPAVTSDCVIFGYDGKELKVLLIKRDENSDAYPGAWALPGGFLRMDGPEPDLNMLECAKRELEEETGLKDVYIREFGVYSDLGRDPRERVITVAHFALVKIQDVKGASDAQDAKWFPAREVSQLAFDHDRILRDALSRLRETIHFEPVGFELLPEVFTMPQLQDLYEAILEVKFDRRNFAKKINAFEILSEVGDRPANAGPRTPFHYRFNKEQYEKMKMKRNGFRLEF